MIRGLVENSAGSCILRIALAETVRQSKAHEGVFRSRRVPFVPSARRYQRLVDEILEVAARLAVPRQPIFHEHDHEMLFRIDHVRRSVGAAPAVRADGLYLIAPGALMNLEPESESVARTPFREERIRLIARHQHHGVRREDSNSVELPAIRDHLQKARVIVRCR